MMLFMIFIISIFVLMGLTAGLTPYYSRKSNQFGVSLPVALQKGNEMKQFQKEFLLWHIVLIVILSAPLYFFSKITNHLAMVQWSGIYLIGGLAVFLVVTSLLFLRMRKKVLALKNALPKETLDNRPQEIVVDTTYRKKRMTVPGWLIIIPCIVIILFTLLMTYENYQQIPERFPIHLNANMEVDRYAERSVLSVLAIPAFQFVILVLIYVSNLSLKKAKQQLSATNTSTSVKSNQAFRMAWSIYQWFLLLFIELLLVKIQMVMIFDEMNLNFPLIVIVFCILSIGSAIFLSFRYGQGGERYHAKEEEVDSVSHYDDDANWKLGIFYFNKKDPSLFVESRFGVGITSNLARWETWAMLVALFGLILLPIFMVN